MVHSSGPRLVGSSPRVPPRMTMPAWHLRRRFSQDKTRLYALLATTLCVLIGLALGAPDTRAQTQSVGPRITAVDPGSAKVNDSVSITGQNLGKAAVVAIYLSDDKEDYKATLSNQSDDKIVFKVPQVKSGSYNISLQIGGTILIQPVRLSVE